MQKAIEAAKFISRELNKDHSFYLEDLNLNKIFEDVYTMNVSTKDENRIICFVVFAYDPDSQKLDIRKDRYENKVSILTGLGADTSSDLFERILNNSDEKFNTILLKYLEGLTNWQWPTIYSLLDYHSSMIRFATQKTEAEKSFDRVTKDGETTTITEDYDIDKIAKVNIQKSDIFKRAIEARRDAEGLLEDIRKEFMPTDHAVQSDLGFTFTDTAKKKVDIYSWRAFIKENNEKKLLSRNQ